ncbi:MAG: Holliday junction resolvase RuvX [Anaerolineae bacterium]
MRLMALDIGERRIGIALSDSGILATPHSVLQRKSKAEDFARLGRLITELKIERVIVGLPYSLSGPEEMGPQARRVQRYAESLAATLSVPIEYFDERYSTVDATAYLARRGQKKIAIDAAAAAVILQNYLDSLKDQPGYPMDTEHG